MATSDPYAKKSDDPPPDLNWATVIKLLTEAREWVTDNPWDDSTCLHYRISKALGLPISYPGCYQYEDIDEEESDDE